MNESKDTIPLEFRTSTSIQVDLRKYRLISRIKIKGIPTACAYNWSLHSWWAGVQTSGPTCIDVGAIIAEYLAMRSNPYWVMTNEINEIIDANLDLNNRMMYDIDKSILRTHLDTERCPGIYLRKRCRCKHFEQFYLVIYYRLDMEGL